MNGFPEINFLRFCFEKHDEIFPLQSDIIPYMDLTFCVSGKMHYFYEGKDVILEAGDAILFPQGYTRKRFHSTESAFYCSFNVSYGDDFTPEISGYIPNCIRSDTVRILESVNHSFKSLSDEKYKKCTALFWYLYYQLTETSKYNENPHIKNIKAYISGRICEQITLEDISRAVHLTPQYCCSIFSQKTGQTLFDFISAQRIELAKSLLVTTDLKFTEISQQCGFGDYNYFSRIFKKFAGMNPTKYKKYSKDISGKMI